MRYKITKRMLTPQEIRILTEEVHGYLHLGWISPEGWRSFGNVYVLTEGKTFIGVCAFFPLGKITKLGPLMIRGKYQGKGYGKKLLRYVTENVPGALYVGSSNPVVVNFASQFGFSEISYLKLPFVIKHYLIAYFLARINRTYIPDAIKKLGLGSKRYRYFFRAA